MMTETRLSVTSVAVGSIKEFSVLITPESTEQFGRTTVSSETEGALMLSHPWYWYIRQYKSLSADRSVRSGW